MVVPHYADRSGASFTLQPSRLIYDSSADDGTRRWPHLLWLCGYSLGRSAYHVLHACARVAMPSRRRPSPDTGAGDGICSPCSRVPPSAASVAVQGALLPAWRNSTVLLRIWTVPLDALWMERSREPAGHGVARRCWSTNVASICTRPSTAQRAECKPISPCAKSAVPAGTILKPAGVLDSCQNRLSTVTDTGTVLGAQSLGCSCV